LTRARTAAAFVVLAVIAGLAAWWAHDRPGDAGNAPAGPVAAAARYVGSERCGDCHAAELAAWRGSQHARAIQRASDTTALGDFDDARFRYGDVTSTFFRRDGHPWVRTDGPDGALGDFQVQYAFGVYPLQQYLLALPGGRLQALSIAWDARPAEAGGQRWFHLYPGERIDAHDELHWTGRQQNWNYMCADCHSTRVQKHYDAATDAYATTFAELTVGCEACHGPGSAHVDWARTHARVPARGLTTALDERRGVAWTRDAATGQPRRSRTRTSQREIEVCAQCHARRAQLAEDYRPGTPFLDAYRPALLGPELYHADGQQRDEVFIWGSWLQSRMHRAGVTCSDCHDPHTQKLRVPGNGVCSQCHLAIKFDSPQHHFHAPGAPGAKCTSCHVPATTYMVVDTRHDHRLSVPRPDLSISSGTPNACIRCHSDKSGQWAADAVARWYGLRGGSRPHFGEALHAGRHARPGAAAGLQALVQDAVTPPIVRATAVDLLAQYPSAAAGNLIEQALSDPDPLVRHAAVLAHQSYPPQAVVSALVPMLRDPVRAVRIEAASLLAPMAHALPPGTAFDSAIHELESVQRGMLGQPEALLMLGNLSAVRGYAARAEDCFRKAIRLDRHFIPAYVNLADLARATQREALSEQILREGLQVVPKAPALRQALGLALMRQGRKDAALAEFAAAHAAAADEPRYAYVYAVALHDMGRRTEAIRVLADSARRGGGRDVLLALAQFSAQDGDRAGAEAAYRALEAINPGDPALPVVTRMRP
jgi:tetratricopeptide (TPR) repeat protein